MSESHIPNEAEPKADGLKPILDNIKQVITDAATVTRQESEPQTPTNDYFQLYREQKEENERLKSVIEAARFQPTAPHPNRDVKPKTFEQARAQVGEKRWNHQMSDTEKLVAMGQDPNQDREFLRRLWGRGADPHLSQDLYKTDPRKYRETKQAAFALNIFGQ